MNWEKNEFNISEHNLKMTSKSNKINERKEFTHVNGDLIFYSNQKMQCFFLCVSFRSTYGQTFLFSLFVYPVPIFCIGIRSQIVTWSTNLLNVQWLRKLELPSLDDLNQFKFTCFVKISLKCFSAKPKRLFVDSNWPCEDQIAQYSLWTKKKKSFVHVLCKLV